MFIVKWRLCQPLSEAKIPIVRFLKLIFFMCALVLAKKQGAASSLNYAFPPSV